MCGQRFPYSCDRPVEVDSLPSGFCEIDTGRGFALDKRDDLECSGDEVGSH